MDGKWIPVQGAVAEKALILEALHREFGFGKVRLERLLDRAEKIKEVVEHGQGKNSEHR